MTESLNNSENSTNSPQNIEEELIDLGEFVEDNPEKRVNLEGLGLSDDPQVTVEATSEKEEDWDICSETTDSSQGQSGQAVGTDDSQSSQSQTKELEEVIAILQQDISSLKSQLDQQVQQTDSFKGQYMRLAADFENFRRRTAKEKEELECQIKKNTVTELLGAIDSFERARSQIKPGTDGEMAIHKSYQGVYKQLVDGLKKLGVSAMRPEGEQFDPNFHEAVFREPTNEHPEGTVLEQLVRGYLLNDKVLRHAMVKVAAPKEEEVVASPEQTDTTPEGEEKALDP